MPTRPHQVTSVDSALIPEAEIERYRELYRNHFKRDITKEAALEQSAKLLSFFWRLYRPVSPGESRVFKHLATTVARKPAGPEPRVGVYSKVHSGQVRDAKEASHD